MYLSPYMTEGFDAAQKGSASLHAGLVRKSDSPQIVRFGGRARTTDIRKLPVCQSAPGRTMAQVRAALMTPNVRLFMTTTSSTFVFLLGFLS